MNRAQQKPQERKSIFRSLFVPLIFIMLLQAAIFYVAAVYGGIEESLSQNATDILAERLQNRKNEIETQFNNKWAALDACAGSLAQRYSEYEERYGSRPFVQDSQFQIQFLRESADGLIDTLRHNAVNGVFLILNDQAEQRAFSQLGLEQKYGLCIRDMDQESNYSGREDLAVERAPSSIIDALGCSLDSWWEARYTFRTRESGDYYYYPLDAAWENPAADGSDLAYCAGVHQISGSDPAMLSYSIPLISEDGYPYGVLGVEISAKHLASLLPNKELNKQDKCCYILALQDVESLACTPVVGTGALYNRCFSDSSVISCADVAATGGFTVEARGDVTLYGAAAALDVYNNNNPFEDRQLTLLALVERDTLFAYIDRVKLTLMAVSLVSLLLGIIGITFVSRRFAAPITALAGRVRGMKAQSDFRLERLGITEIDQLVDSIEELNRNVSKNSARTEFFSRMSHDMRTPMNAIISFSSPELLEGATIAVKDDYLKKIHASGEYLLALINEVLDMTKIESDRTELRPEPVQACRLFDTSIPIVEKLAQKKGVAFSSRLRLDPRAYVMADEQHLNQVVMNLLSNAVKFTPAGGDVQMEASMRDDGADPNRVCCRIAVSDTGIGMSEAFMQNLYTPFEQENSGQEGTGLGLSIAKKLVELMGGTIECTSKRNVGTTFTVTVPLRKARAGEAGDETQAAQADDADYSALRGMRILICEDNAINTQIISSLLERKGILVETAINGLAGVNAFAAAAPGTYRAILMDIRMPVMDGLTATRRIRALEREDAAAIPIIAMTANAFEEDERASRDAGMNAHLAKPVDSRKLFDTLVRLMA